VKFEGVGWNESPRVPAFHRIFWKSIVDLRTNKLTDAGKITTWSVQQTVGLCHAYISRCNRVAVINTLLNRYLASIHCEYAVPRYDKWQVITVTLTIGQSVCPEPRGVQTGLQLRFDFDSTAIRPHYDHSTTYVTNGLLYCGLNK